MKEFTAKTFYTGSFYQRLSVVVTQLVIWMAIGSVDRAQAAQRTWNGSAPNWSETSAWQEGSVPGVDDEVMIIDPSTQSMRLDRDFTIDAFTLLPSTHLDDLSLNRSQQCHSRHQSGKAHDGKSQSNGGQSASIRDW